MLCLFIVNPNKLHSLIYYFFPVILISCPFFILNSFSIFGYYISARLQIIWRPNLWLVWSFTQMVSLLEFSIATLSLSSVSPIFLIHLSEQWRLLNTSSSSSFLVIAENGSTWPTLTRDSSFVTHDFLCHLLVPLAWLLVPHLLLISSLLYINLSFNLRGPFPLSKLSERKLYFRWSVNAKFFSSKIA